MTYNLPENVEPGKSIHMGMGEPNPLDVELIMTAFNRWAADPRDEDEVFLADLDHQIAINNWETQ